MISLILAIFSAIIQVILRVVLTVAKVTVNVGSVAVKTGTKAIGKTTKKAVKKGDTEKNGSPVLKSIKRLKSKTAEESRGRENLSPSYKLQKQYGNAVDDAGDRKAPVKRAVNTAKNAAKNVVNLAKKSVVLTVSSALMVFRLLTALLFSFAMVANIILIIMIGAITSTVAFSILLAAKTVAEGV